MEEIQQKSYIVIDKDGVSRSIGGICKKKDLKFQFSELNDYLV